MLQIVLRALFLKQCINIIGILVCLQSKKSIKTWIFLFSNVSLSNLRNELKSLDSSKSVHETVKVLKGNMDIFSPFLLNYFNNIIDSYKFFKPFEINITSALCESFPYSEFFWSVFSGIWTKYISPSSVRMRENTDQKNSEYGYFLHSSVHKRTHEMIKEIGRFNRSQQLELPDLICRLWKYFFQKTNWFPPKFQYTTLPFSYALKFKKSIKQGWGLGCVTYRPFDFSQKHLTVYLMI